jgi:hypothetical protein
LYGGKIAEGNTDISISGAMTKKPIPKKKRKLPLPCKFDVYRQKIILDAVRKGYSRTVTAAVAGIHIDTLERWIRSGREGTSKQHKAFYEKLIDAQRKGVAADLKVIDECAAGQVLNEVREVYDATGKLVSRIKTKRKVPGSWKAKSWKLRNLMRYFPETYVLDEGQPADDGRDEPICIVYTEDKD